MSKMEKKKNIGLFFHEDFVYIIDPVSMMVWREKIGIKYVADQKEWRLLNIDLSKIEGKDFILPSLFNNITNLLKYGFFTEKSINIDKEERKLNLDDIDFVVLNPSTQCNLNCWYCYVDKKLKNRYKTVRSFQFFKRILDNFLSQRNKRKNLAITCCYTSEVTQEFDFLESIMGYVSQLNKKGYNILFFLPSTNLFEISEKFINFVNSYGYLAVSIDLTNNAQIDKALENLSHFSEDVIKSCHLLLHPDVEDIFHIYNSFMQFFDFVSMRPVRISKEIKSYQWSDKKLKELDEKMALFVKDLLNLSDEKLIAFLKKLGPTDYFMRYFIRIVQRKKNLYRCPAGFNAISIGPDNKIYPCSGLFGSEKYIGEITENGIMLLKSQKTQQPVTKITECSTCSIRYYCGGPCLDWVNRTGNSTVVKEECTINKIFFKYATILALELVEARKGVLKALYKIKKIKGKLNYITSFNLLSTFFA